MLRRHAADNGFAIAPERQGGGKRLRFRLHLGGGFDDDLRLAAGTRCFQMRFGIGGNGPVFRLPAVFRLPLRLREAFGQMPCLLVNQIVGEKNIRRFAPADVFPRRIRQQQHPRARVPRRQHRAGKQRGIVKPQRGSLHACLFQTA